MVEWRESTTPMLRFGIKFTPVANIIVIHVPSFMRSVFRIPDFN